MNAVRWIQSHAVGRHLVDRQIELRRRRLAERARTHVAGDADHGLVVRALAVRPGLAAGDPPADRILAGKCGSGERLADHHHLEPAPAVGVGERPALDDRNPHRLEVARRDHAKPAADRVAAVERDALGDQAVAVAAAAHRHLRRDRRGGDAGNLRCRRRPAAGRSARPSRDRDRPLPAARAAPRARRRIESGVDALQRERAADQQPGADEQAAARRPAPRRSAPVRSRSRTPPMPALRPPSLITVCTSTRAARSAGARPNSNALASATTTA